jgi:peptidoglycan hydrolase-like protein with peptidoglycan-binding domain
MKRVILATIATAAFLIPAVAQQSSQISPRHLSESEVRKIQQALDDRGFKSGKVDGSWGPETEAAFKDFQKWATLSPTGEVDPISIAVLGLNVGDFELARARP